MIAIINCGLSNLSSVKNALRRLGIDSEIIDRPDQLYNASHLILPGVGSFRDGMDSFVRNRWVDAIRDAVLKEGIPILGICLGMQLLASCGTEGGDIKGLDLIKGNVAPLRSIGCDKRVPHMGWNDVSIINYECPLFSGIPDGSDFYFVHSYAFQPVYEENIAAITNYGIPVSAVVGEGIIWGTQFHPEKSSKAGMQLLKNFSGV